MHAQEERQHVINECSAPTTLSHILFELFPRDRCVDEQKSVSPGDRVKQQKGLESMEILGQKVMSLFANGNKAVVEMTGSHHVSHRCLDGGPGTYIHLSKSE